MKAFKNAWTGINISVVVTIFTVIPLIANKKVLFIISQFVFRESNDVTTLLKFSQKSPPFQIYPATVLNQSRSQ